MIAYTPPSWADDLPPTAGEIVVGPHPDMTGWSDNYAYTTGSCYVRRKKVPHWRQVALVLTDFHAAVVRDGIDPRKAHQAFLAIDEFRRVISPDIAGAD
jgi:hypothetical protein